MTWSAAMTTALGLIVLMILSLVLFALLCVIREPMRRITFFGRVVIAAAGRLHVAVTSAGFTCCCLAVCWVITAAAAAGHGE